jgi:hypothetical protein
MNGHGFLMSEWWVLNREVVRRIKNQSDGTPEAGARVIFRLLLPQASGLCLVFVGVI